MVLALSLLALPLHAEESKVAKYFAGHTLTDQNGKRVVIDELMKGRTVVMHSFFANCTASCPKMIHTLAELQGRFSKHLGRDLWFVSITVDPENDTPENLKRYATRNLARPGWSFLTGSRAEVDGFLKLIDQYAAKRDDHQAVMLIGNDATGLFMKAQALAPAKDLGDVIQKVLEEGE